MSDVPEFTIFLDANVLTKPVTRTRPTMRGATTPLFGRVTPIGSPFVGWLSGVAGARWSIGMGSLAALAVSLGAAWWVRRNWHLTARLEGFPPHVVVVDARGDKVARGAGWRTARGARPFDGSCGRG